MEVLLNIAMFDFDFVEEAIIHELLVERADARDLGYERFNFEDLDPEVCKHNFRFEKEHIQLLAARLDIPHEIVMENRCVISGIEGLCICLRRLAYPNRLRDLEFFGFSAPFISTVANTVTRIILENKGHLLDDLTQLPWLNRNKLQYYSQAISRRGAPLQNCWGFIDGTARPMCRPSINQQQYYSGHKRFHCLKYQSVLCPDGIIVHLSGPYSGRRHDGGIFRESGLYRQLQRCVSYPDVNFVLYGDRAYRLTDLVLKPYTRILNPEQRLFNLRMSSVRQSVEWGFGKITTQFAFPDFKKNQKLLLQDIGAMYKTATILTNCHTCLYGSLTSDYFDIVPPTLEEYLL